VSRKEPLPCRVVLVRHASARGQGRFLGQQDAPLSAIGRRQLAALVRKLRSYTIDAIYCSDLSRAVATAAAIARRRKVAPAIRPQLREAKFGLWEGLAWDEVVEQFPAMARRWVSGRSALTAPGGEPLPRFKQRIARELIRIVAAHPGRCVVVVTHAGVIRVAIGTALGMADRNLFRIAQSPCAVNVVDYFRHGVIVTRVNA
jgi:broad specificity phosphatase PhoE